MFMTSAKHYFEYLREALYEDMPTMLVKILGIHTIKVSGSFHNILPKWSPTRTILLFSQSTITFVFLIREIEFLTSLFLTRSLCKLRYTRNGAQHQRTTPQNLCMGTKTV